MPKLSIFNEAPIKEVTQSFQLKLRKNEDEGYVELLAVDDAGEEICALLTIFEDGTLFRDKDVPKDLGFQLGNYFRIKIEE